jgi:hypothetical protein
MQPSHKRLAIIYSILFIPTGMLFFFLIKHPVRAAYQQTDHYVYLPFIIHQDRLTDIAVTDMITPVDVVILGDVIDIQVLVENVGDQDVEVDIPVTLTDTTDALQIGSQTIPALGVGVSTTLTFTWDTGQVLRGINPVLDGDLESGGVQTHDLEAVQQFSDDNSTNDTWDSVQPIIVWSENSALGLDLILTDGELIHIAPHSGNWAVWMGGEENESASITQTVTIPENNPSLSYWYWIQSSADIFPCDTPKEGVGGVKINGTTVGQDHRLCGNLDTGWLVKTIPLGGYAGQNVVLEFWAQTPSNFYGGPNLYIDDIWIDSQ